MYYIWAIIPKDLKLEKAFVVAYKNEYCKFKAEYDYAVKNNKILGRYLYVHNNDGLDAFNVIQLEKVDCNKDEIGMYKAFYQTTIDSFMDISKKCFKAN